MKYCRYCAYCVNGDTYYCNRHNKELSRVDIVTHCADHVMSELGDVDTGRQYMPRKQRSTEDDMYKQITIEEV